MQIVVYGLFVALVPPLLTWVIGPYVFKISSPDRPSLPLPRSRISLNCMTPPTAT